MKVYHEAPLSIFDEVQRVTDGDYALVHLFETNDSYWRKFREAVDKGRDVILDNSIFELGEAFDSEHYAHWIRKLHPTWYIVPDFWKNGPKTEEMFFNFLRSQKDLPGLRIGVAQGNTIDEVCECYYAIESYCDMVAFNLDGSQVWRDEAGNRGKHMSHCEAMSAGRYLTIAKMHEFKVINTNKPHHLLGCGVPQEVSMYGKMPWIRSIDTSNPIVHGLEGIRYDLYGLETKSPAKMCDLIDSSVSLTQWEDILFNIKSFKLLM